MISVTRWFGLLILASVAWYFLGAWLPSPSERVYLLVPPLFIIGALSYGRTGAAGLRNRLLDILMLAGAVLLVAAAYGTYAPGIVGPSWGNLRRVLRLRRSLFRCLFHVFANPCHPDDADALAAGMPIFAHAQRFNC